MAKPPGPLGKKGVRRHYYSLDARGWKTGKGVKDCEAFGESME